MNILLKKHKKYFPEIENLYHYQDEAIKNLLKSKNTLSIVPTGGGKSLVFQLCALEFTGISIIISPLLALMIEQVSYLSDKKINVVTINSNSSFNEQRNILRDLRRTKPKMIYVSPERLQNYYFRSAILNCGQNISMVAIDEAHCISQWGVDFRPEYAQIKSFIEFLNEKGQTPVTYALTATLSELPRKDIKKEFDIDDDSELIAENVIRNNLISKFEEVQKENEKYEKVKLFLRECKSRKAIVYMYNKLKCEEISDKLNQDGISSAYYHADLDLNRKKDLYSQFLKGEINVLVSTTAFGMGMNIPDIDSIIHYHLPGSVEEYYQHIGRAARVVDKCPTGNCLGLWSEENFKVLKRRIRNENIVDIDILNKAFEYFELHKEPKSITSIDYTSYKNAKYKLPLLRFLFEKHGLMKSIGEVNGSPNTIEFNVEPEFWKKMKRLCKIDSFIYASVKGNIEMQEIIDFINKEDLKGNINKIPAYGKTLFFINYYNKLPKRISDKIVNEVNTNIDYKIKQFEQLETLYKYDKRKDHREYIAIVLGVKYP